ncbi:hypothetical protein Dda_4312 [Drechslerella dactyloides]|uniref:F-box domain-containing protein n=1 Tax=Drechslerella dactyloides TaxID=74499 RepID=A0AAD6IX32_DREDA|nr:hypothetical protein Dda_4312 [Drechslerella dactyloides]
MGTPIDNDARRKRELARDRNSFLCRAHHRIEFVEPLPKKHDRSVPHILSDLTVGKFWKLKAQASASNNELVRLRQLCNYYNISTTIDKVEDFIGDYNDDHSNGEHRSEPVVDATETDDVHGNVELYHRLIANELGLNYGLIDEHVRKLQAVAAEEKQTKIGLLESYHWSRHLVDNARPQHAFEAAAKLRSPESQTSIAGNKVLDQGYQRLNLMNPRMSCYMNALPTELLTHILSFLPWQSHISCFQVCKLWADLLHSPALRSNRYLNFAPSTPPCPRVHNLFTDVGLECSIDRSQAPAATITSISFVATSEEQQECDDDFGSNGNSAIDAEGANVLTVDISDHPILAEKLLHFQSWRHRAAIRRELWTMGVLLLWNQRGYEYGSHRDRQLHRQDWFQFVNTRDNRNQDGDDGEGGSTAAAAAGNNIKAGTMDMDVTVREFLEAVGRYIATFGGLGSRQEVKVRVGMYRRFGVVMVSNVGNEPWTLAGGLNNLG